MHIGAVFPQIEIEADPAAVRDYAQAAEALGYHHVLAYDHVLGANAASRPGWRGFYDHRDPFYEPFVLFAFMAAATRALEFVTGIIILPQRQTALVAKQAACLDVLCGGRLRFGIAIGWNDVEYEGLGQNFHDRGARFEEQVEVLRLLWSQELVTFRGRWHSITDAGLNPLPVQRPIPLWLGGEADAVLRRAGQWGAGWMPVSPADDALKAKIATLHGYARAADRQPETIGLNGFVRYGQLAPAGAAGFRAELDRWRALGASHATLDTMRAGLKGAKAHIEALRRFKEATG